MIVKTLLFWLLLSIPTAALAQPDSTYQPSQTASDAMFILDNFRQNVKEDASSILEAVDQETMAMFQSFVKREYIAGVATLVISGLILLMTIVGMLVMISAYKRHETTDWLGGMFAICCVGILVIVSILCGTQTFQRLVTPETFAVQKILYMIKGGY